MARKLHSFYGNSEFLNKMLSILVGICFIQGAFFAFASFTMIGQYRQAIEKLGLGTESTVMRTIDSYETFMYIFVVFAICVSAIFSCWLGLKFCRDAVGAIYRIRKEMEKMAVTQNMYQIQLRENDYFRDFANTFNSMVVSLWPLIEFGKASAPSADSSSGESFDDEFTPTPDH